MQTESPLEAVRKEIEKAVVGQKETINLLLTALISGGHVILEGVPGLAKTLLVHGLAKSLDLSFNRVQFTPDLIPSDITGTDIVDIQNGGKEFRFVKGPVFTQILLADEINRTPPKTQSALLQAMQEKKVSVLGQTYLLPEPFLVIATQNPLEYEGTYPLPEAQLDRFFMHLPVGYPSREEEILILDHDYASMDEVKPVVDKKEILAMTKKAKEIPVSDKLRCYAVDLVRNTRPEHTSSAYVKETVRWGASPRSAQMLLTAAKSFAFLNGAKIADKSHLDAMLLPVLRHRLILTERTATDGISSDNILETVKKSVEVNL